MESSARRKRNSIFRFALIHRSPRESGAFFVQLEELKPVVKELMVESVKADNLKEIVVTLNHAVTKESVTKDAFALSKQPATQQLVPVLQEDGKTIVITLNNELINQKQYKLTTVGLVAAEDANVKLAKTETEFATLDAMMPEVLSVEFSGPKSLTIKFSEPIKTPGEPVIEIGNLKISVNKSKITTGSSIVTVPVYSNFVEGKEYKIEIKDFADYANYKNLNKTFNLTYAKETFAPTAEVVAVAQEYVVVQFSKPVVGLTTAHFFHTFPHYTAKALKDMEDKTVDPNTAYDKVKVLFYETTSDKALAEGTVRFVAMSKVGTKQIKDLWGNAFADFEAMLQVSADKVAPEVKEIKATGKMSFEVTFSKSVALESKHIEVLDKDNKVIPALGIAVAPASGEKFTVTTMKSLEGSTVTVTISGARDTSINQNLMVNFSQAVDFKDQTAPKFENATYKAAAGNEPGYVYVFFSEDMDPEGALKGSNYRLVHKVTGNVVSFKNAPEFYTNNKTVRIVLADKETVDTANYDLVVIDLKDLSGNALLNNRKQFVVHSSVVDVTVASKTAVNPKTVVVVFNTPIAGVDQSLVALNGTAKIESIDVNDKVVKFTFDKAIEGAELAALTQTMEFEIGAVVGLLGGKNVAKESSAITDEIKPELKSAKLVVKNEIELTFTRTLNGTDTDYANDLVIVDPNGKTLIPGTDFTTSGHGPVKIKLTTPIAGQYMVASQSTPFNLKTGSNFAKPFAAQPILIADTVKPEFVASPKGADNSDSKLVLTASEKLFTAADGTTAVGANVDKALFTVGGGHAAITVNPTHKDQVITIEFLTTAQDNDTVTIQVNKFYDQAGNGNAQVQFQFTTATGWVKQ